MTITKIDMLASIVQTLVEHVTAKVRDEFEGRISELERELAEAKGSIDDLEDEMQKRPDEDEVSHMIEEASESESEFVTSRDVERIVEGALEEVESKREEDMEDEVTAALKIQELIDKLSADYRRIIRKVGR